MARSHSIASPAQRWAPSRQCLSVTTRTVENTTPSATKRDAIQRAWLVNRRDFALATSELQEMLNIDLGHVQDR
jgi:hypothetical protein